MVDDVWLMLDYDKWLRVGGWWMVGDGWRMMEDVRWLMDCG
jgi:hypothetical protein